MPIADPRDPGPMLQPMLQERMSSQAWRAEYEQRFKAAFDTFDGISDNVVIGTERVTLTDETIDKIAKRVVELLVERMLDKDPNWTWEIPRE